MKTQTDAYIAAEEATERKPIKLYRIWYGSNAWYYTSGDAAVVYDGHTYAPAAIHSGANTYDETLDVSTLSLQIDRANPLILQYLAQNPIAIVWVEVSLVHRDQVPIEISVQFIGHIKSVKFQGVKAEIACVGFEHYLKKEIPLFRYQISCNHVVFDADCGLVAALYKLTTIITLDSTGTILTSADFALQSDGYYTYGEVQYQGESRLIIAHAGNQVTLLHPMLNLASGNAVDAYPGCDGKAETCRDKYNNMLHFLGFPFIPVENPAMRT